MPKVKNMERRKRNHKMMEKIHCDLQNRKMRTEEAYKKYISEVCSRISNTVYKRFGNGLQQLLKSDKYLISTVYREIVIKLEPHIYIYIDLERLMDSTTLLRTGTCLLYIIFTATKSS